MRRDQQEDALTGQFPTVLCAQLQVCVLFFCKNPTNAGSRVFVGELPDRHHPVLFCLMADALQVGFGGFIRHTQTIGDFRNAMPLTD